MADETQASAGAVATPDNPSPTPEAGAEKGSAAAATPQEHRDIDIAETLAKLDPKQRSEILGKLDPGWLLEHPGVKSTLARHAKSEADKAVSRLEKKLQVDRERERIKTADPYEVGQELQRRLAEQDQTGLLRDQIRQEVGTEAYDAGYKAAYQEVSLALDDLPHWKGMDRDERQRFIEAQPQFSKFLASVLAEGVTRETRRALDSQLKKAQERQEREDEVEARTAEQSPNLGSNTPAASDQEFIAAYARGESNDHARAKRLSGL
jgi:hypothetical protein